VGRRRKTLNVNVRVTVQVGNVDLRADVDDCGPDALGDAVRQVTMGMLILIDRDDVRRSAVDLEEA